MSKQSFYREQAEIFRDYAGGNPNGNLLSLFEEWAESENVHGRDRHEIWRIARASKPAQVVIISDTSDDYVRLFAAIDILVQAYAIRLDRIMEKRKNKLDKT